MTYQIISIALLSAKIRQSKDQLVCEHINLTTLEIVMRTATLTLYLIFQTANILFENCFIFVCPSLPIIDYCLVSQNK